MRICKWAASTLRVVCVCGSLNNHLADPGIAEEQINAVLFRNHHAMMRAKAAYIQQLHLHLPLAGVIAETVELVEHSDHVRGPCPAHVDVTKSLHVQPARRRRSIASPVAGAVT